MCSCRTSLPKDVQMCSRETMVRWGRKHLVPRQPLPPVAPAPTQGRGSCVSLGTCRGCPLLPGCGDTGGGVWTWTPADSSVAQHRPARGPTRKNRLLSWQGNIIRVLQAGRLRQRVYFRVTHSGWPRSLWRTRKFDVSWSPGPVSSPPVL